MFSLKALVEQIPVPEVRDLSREMIGRGMSIVEVINEIVEFLDALIDWTKVIKGPAGKVAEASDGPILRRIVTIIVKSVSRS